jgi:hypothetical protein
MRSTSYLRALHQLPNARTNLHKTWYVYHGNWAHLNGALHKFLPLVCVSVCVSLLSLKGNVSVKHVLKFCARQQLARNYNFSPPYLHFKMKLWAPCLLSFFFWLSHISHYFNFVSVTFCSNKTAHTFFLPHTCFLRWIPCLELRWSTLPVLKLSHMSHYLNLF